MGKNKQQGACGIGESSKNTNRPFGAAKKRTVLKHIRNSRRTPGDVAILIWATDSTVTSTTYFRKRTEFFLLTSATRSNLTRIWGVLIQGTPPNLNLTNFQYSIKIILNEST